MTWEIIAGIITLVTFGIAICKIVANNTKVITELRSSVDTLNTTLNEQKEEQRVMHDRVAEHDVELGIIHEQINNLLKN